MIYDTFRIIGKATAIVFIAIAAMIVIPVFLVILGWAASSYPVYAAIIAFLIFIVAMFLTVAEYFNER